MAVTPGQYGWIVFSTEILKWRECAYVFDAHIFRKGAVESYWEPAAQLWWLNEDGTHGSILEPHSDLGDWQFLRPFTPEDTAVLQIADWKEKIHVR